MKFSATFQAETVVQNNGPIIQTVPEGEEVPPGVGISVTGRYVSVPCPVSASYLDWKSAQQASGFFTFTRTISAATLTGLLGTGVLIAHLTVGEHKILITTTYTLEMASPKVAVKHTSVITGALVDGHNYYGAVKVTTVDGGLTYHMAFRLKPLC